MMTKDVARAALTAVRLGVDALRASDLPKAGTLFATAAAMLVRRAALDPATTATVEAMDAARSGDIGIAMQRATKAEDMLDAIVRN
jgi:hypothetical protein